jgi:hypothetical protein
MLVKDKGYFLGEYTFTPGVFGEKIIPNSFELLLWSFLESGVNDMEKVERYRKQDLQ